MDSKGFLNQKAIVKMPWWHVIKKYDVFVSHARYTPKVLNKIMGKDYKLISIIRDPAERLNSQYYFGNLANKRNLTLNKLVKRNKMDMRLVCGNAFVTAFGIDCNKRDYYNVSLVQSKIAEINKKFDLILIQEFMEESLILLKRLLSMKWEDVVQISIKKTTHKEKIQKKVRKMLMKRLWPDYLFYDFFKAKFQREVAKHANLIAREKETLLWFQNKAEKECGLELTPHEQASTHVTSLTSNPTDFCVKALGRYDFREYMENYAKQVVESQES